MADSGGVQSARFPSTHWSAIHYAADREGQHHQDALNSFLRRYQPALESYLVHQRGLPSNDAQDALQQFFLDKIVIKNALQNASQQKGRFRSFILTVLDNFVVSQWRSDRRRRLPQVSHEIEGDFADVNRRQNPDPTNSFEVLWARETINEALARMKAECTKSDRPDLWGVFQSRLLNPIMHDQTPASYNELVAQFGFSTPAQASNALITSKRMFSRILREVVGEYASDGQTVEDEILDLIRILSRSAAM